MIISSYHLRLGVLAQSDGWGHMDGWGGGWMWVWSSLMMLSWVAIIATAVWLVGRNRGDGRARDILDERLARGELSPEEHRECVRQLR